MPLPEISLEDLRLPVSVAAESIATTPGLASLVVPNLPRFPIDIPRRGGPIRIWLGDDDANLIEALQVECRARFGGLIDLHCENTRTAGFMSRLLVLPSCQPDLVVLDINLSVDGRSSFEVVASLRKVSGGPGLVVVMATGQNLESTARGELVRQPKNVPDDPAHWHESAIAAGADSLLYRKAGSAEFLSRLAEGFEVWKLAARRRAWSDLLSNLAEDFDANKPDIRVFATKAAAYLNANLGMQSAFVRWRRSETDFELLGKAGAETSATGTINLDPSTIPLLQKILDQRAEEKPVVLNEGVPDDLCGDHMAGIAGRRFIGACAFLGTRPYGFITLLRNRSWPAFDTTDQNFLHALASLVAAALGRYESLEDARKRQVELLLYAKNSTQAGQPEDVCVPMVKMLHKMVHHDDGKRGKVSCRLVNFASGELVHFGRVGYGKNDSEVPIRIDNKDSVYVRTVLPRQDLANPPPYVRIDDVTADGVRFYDTGNGRTRSELCVALPIGKHAIGAVNLEHTLVGYYTEADAQFVQAVAAIAAQALQNSLAHRVQHSMLNFSNKFAAPERPHLEGELERVLQDLAQPSAVINLTPSNRADIHLPWRANSVSGHFVTPEDKTRILGEINRRYSQEWNRESHWFARLVLDSDWTQPKRKWVNLTTDQADFSPVTLTNHTGLKQLADAVLWLRADEDGEPTRALLLLWMVPPPIGDMQLELLAELAQLFSSMNTIAGKVDDHVRDRIAGNAERKIGAVMAHFRHRLTGLVSALGNDVNEAIVYLRNDNRPRLVDRLESAKKTIDDMDQAYEASLAYVKEKQVKEVRDVIKSIIDPMRDDQALQAHLKYRDAKIEWPRNDQPMAVRADVAITRLALFSLVQNACDALIRLPPPKRVVTIQCHRTRDRKWVFIEVVDYGPGVRADIREKLFDYGVTSKDHGLGSALAFAQARLRETGADLSFEGTDAGTRFRVSLPADNQ